MPEEALTLLTVCVNLHLRDARTDGQTDRQTPRIEFGASVTSGGNNFNEFSDIDQTTVDPGFYPFSLKFLKFIFLIEALRFIPP